MIQKAQAIVLRTYNYRETSKIAIFYSREFGKISGLFKGIRKEPEKFATNLELASLNDLVFYKRHNSGLHLVSQCDLKEGFVFLRKDLKKYFALNYALELVNAIMPPEDKNEEVFKLLLWFIKDLSRLCESEKLISIFQIKILSLSGFKPHLDSCVVCNKSIDKKVGFSSSLGGFVCERCKFRDRNIQPVLKGTVASLVHIQKTPCQESLRLGIAYSIKKELNLILDSFLTFHLERKLKTWEFVS